jgi:Holliday junction resolvase RusA-like endonuclease
MFESSKLLSGWTKAMVSTFVSRRERHHPYTGAVRVVIYFFLRRPASAKKDAMPTSRPDVDKLARAVLDALTQARIIVDDSAVVELIAHKFFGGERETGADVHVCEL